MPTEVSGYAAYSAEEALKPISYTLRELKADDVEIDIKYCGLCHSDIHMARNEVGVSSYPIVPGHEIAGIVRAVGADVKSIKVGDRVGVGCLVGSCQSCDACCRDLEPYCSQRTQTYNGKLADGTFTKGGFSTGIVAPEHFVCAIPEAIPLEKAGPLLCAGVTTYSALKFYGLDEPGKRIGVHGLGGLGHMAVQLIKAFGGIPVVFSHSASKAEDAFKLGASDFVLFGDKEKFDSYKEKLDGIIDTVAGSEALTSLFDLVKFGCTVVAVGVPSPGKNLEAPGGIIFRRKQLGGSLIGGLKETREMLSFCAEKNVLPWTEMIKMDQINEAIDRTCKSDVKFRFVIDMSQ